LAVRSKRLAWLALLGAGAIAFAVWPFVVWWLGQPAQAAIDHFSRHNFVVDDGARFLGLWLPYSLWLLALPLVVFAGVRRRTLAPAALAAAALFVLSLGGTTPLPSWLYGSHWEWLTYERYTLWAAPLLLIFAAMGLRRLSRGPRTALRLAAIPPVAILLVFVGWAAWYGRLTPFEPARLNLQPAADFLNQQDGGAYLTLGFGDQLSRLSILTTAPSIDGDYNTARTNPLLTHSGVDKLDSIRYWDPRAETLRVFLRQPERTGLTWVLANDAYYDGLLATAGWMPDRVLSDGVVVWRPQRAVQPVAPTHVETAVHRLESAWWGIVPLLAFAIAIWALCREYLVITALKRQIGRANTLFRHGSRLRRLRKRDVRGPLATLTQH
jgi:hypothetical protein